MRQRRFSILLALTMSFVTLIMPLLETAEGPWAASGLQNPFPDCSNPKQNRIHKPFASAVRADANPPHDKVVDITLTLLQANHHFLVSPIGGSLAKGDTPYVHFTSLTGATIFGCAELVNGPADINVSFSMLTTSGPIKISYEVYYTKVNADGTKVRKITMNADSPAIAASASEAESLARQQAYDTALALGFQIDQSAITVTSTLLPDGTYFAYASVPDSTNQADVVDPDLN